jgi:hypothetical protein
MTSLPFQKINQLKELLERASPADLADLVLIFTCNEHDDCLFVYNRTTLPEMDNPAWETIRLDSLAAADYAGYDGPVIGFETLDLLFPDVPTHGIHFYNIRHIFDDLDQQQEYIQTSYRLAVYQYNQSEKFRPNQAEGDMNRWNAKIVQLALPRLLANRSLEGLVAALPSEGLKDYLDETPDSQGITLIYVKDIEKLRHFPHNKSQWIVTLDDLSLINPHLKDNPCLINLRSIMRHMGETWQLSQTCLDLAGWMWQVWQDTHNQEYQAAAYSLAAEGWLAREDEFDLVALLPHRDFNRFRISGEALRIYRTPRISSIDLNLSGGPRISLGDLINSVTSAEHSSKMAIEEYQTSPISFRILTPLLENVCKFPVIDLGPVLYKAGLETDLARTCWLLARDLLTPPAQSWIVINAKPSEITELALHATAINGLIDPWRWRQARYQQFIEGSYTTLGECLINQEKRSSDPVEAAYCRAQRDWYGCYTTLDIRHNLTTMRTACQEMSNASRPPEDHDPGHDDLEYFGLNQTSSPMVRRAASLAQISQRLMYPTQAYNKAEEGHNLPLPFAVANFLRQAADSTTALPIPSMPFEQRLHTFEGLHSDWETIQLSLGSKRPSYDELTHLHDEYDRLVRVAYAPAHELAVLQWACRQDMQRIQQLREAIETGPVLQIRLRNPQIILGRSEKLSLDLENYGGANASQVQVEISPSRQFELVTGSPVYTFNEIFPTRRYPLAWEIRPLENELNLRINVRYVDQKNKPHTGLENIAVKVVEPRKARVRFQGGILYQAGTPVSGGLFFGRKDELRRILRRLLGYNTQPILLRGPRRMGKTSTMRQVAWLLNHRGTLRQQLDFSAAEEIELQGLTPISTSLQGTSAIENFTGRWFQSIYQEICSALSVNYDQEKVTRDFERTFPTVAFRRNMKQILVERPVARVVLMVDEWDELRSPQLAELAKNLRYIMEDPELNQWVRWIVSSTWTLSEAHGQFSSPFYNQAFPIEIKELEWDSASQLVVLPSQQMNVTWQGSAVVTALEQTGCRPYLTQLVCSSMMDYLDREQHDLVDSNMVSLVTNRLIQSTQASRQLYGFLWDTSSPHEDEGHLHWLGRLILWALDNDTENRLTYNEIKESIDHTFANRGFEPLDPQFFSEEFAEQMTQLEFIFDVIAREGDLFGFSVPLAQQWFHRVVRDLSDPVGQAHNGMLQDCQDWMKRREAKNA